MDAVTAAVTPPPGRRESFDTAATPVGGGGMTSDDDVDGHMTKTDTCYSFLVPEPSTPQAEHFNGQFSTRFRPDEVFDLIYLIISSLVRCKILLYCTPVPRGPYCGNSTVRPFLGLSR